MVTMGRPRGRPMAAPTSGEGSIDASLLCHHGAGLDDDLVPVRRWSTVVAVSSSGIIEQTLGAQGPPGQCPATQNNVIFVTLRPWPLGIYRSKDVGTQCGGRISELASGRAPGPAALQ